MSGKRISLLLVCVLVAMMIAGCGQDNVGLANPASVYCEEQGGELDIRDEEGGQVGYCLFDDGSECEEWAYFNGECQPGDSLEDEESEEGAAGLANPASVYCEEQGGELDIRDEEDGQVGYCLFEDGSECEEWAFFRNECQPGENFGDS